MGLFRRNKNNNKPLIKQIIDLVPQWLFKSCVKVYNSGKGCSKYFTFDQFVALTFGQLSKCQTLSDISTGIGISETYISEEELRLVHVYKEDENKVIEIITNQLDWKAIIIADLYKKRWDIELFFKALKQNLQAKTFLETSENAVKSQIYVALITYFLILDFD